MNSFALFIFYSTGVVQAEGCGDIIYLGDNEGEEIRLPIENCDDPFSLLDPSFNLTVLPVYTLAGEALDEGASVATELPTGLSLSVDSIEPYILSEHSLFLHEGQDYREMENGLNYDFTITDPGTYTVVATVMTEVGGGLSEGAISLWLKSFRDVILPTAHAQVIELNFGRAALTFTVEEEQIPGASSVLFLPGIQASRLYTKGILGTEDQLWEPNVNSDVAYLAMDEDGMSLNDIYTRDVIDTALGSFDVYNTFIEFMNTLESEGTINDWKPFAYDWRYDVRDIVISGTWYENGVRGLVSTVEDMAKESFTGRVTIIAHSNGGLLAKELLIELERINQVDLVDKLVFVGVPHLGTPKALGVLLHGMDQQQALGLVIDDETARDVSITMPGVYGLLPTKKYFTDSDTTLVTTDGSEATDMVGAYGNISSYEEMSNFLTDSLDTREEAVDINEPATLNETLLARASARRDFLDDWTAPPSVTVYEIVGTGVSTIESIEYRRFPCITASCVIDGSEYMKPYPKFTTDGDGTVVELSAGGYGGDKTQVNLDLKSEGDGLFRPNRTHPDITESSTVQALMKEIIRYPYLSETLNLEHEFTRENEEYLVIGTHSPVTIAAVTPDGKRLGLAEDKIYNEVIGGQYFELGDSTYLVLPKIEPFDVTVTGEGDGVYSLTIDEIDLGQSQAMLHDYRGASTSADMTAGFSFAAGEFSPIETDFDGDGVVDYIETLDGDEIDVEPNYTYEDLKQAIVLLELPNRYERIVMRKFDLALKLSQHEGEAYHKLEGRALSSLERTLLRYERRGLVSPEHMATLKEIISHLKNKT